MHDTPESWGIDDGSLYSLYEASLTSIVLLCKPNQELQWLFYDILDINIAGIPYILSPHPHVFSLNPLKVLVRYSNLEWLIFSVLLCFPVGHKGYSMIHSDSIYVCIYIFSPFVCQLNFSHSYPFGGLCETEWSSPHLALCFSVVTFCQTTGNLVPPIPPSAHVYSRARSGDSLSLLSKKTTSSKEHGSVW